MRQYMDHASLEISPGWSPSPNSQCTTNFKTLHIMGVISKHGTSHHIKHPHLVFGTTLSMNSNNGFSHNKMLFQHKPCSFNATTHHHHHNLPTSPRMSDDSSEETCTILQWRNKCQKRPGIRRSSTKVLNTTPTLMIKKLSLWLLSLWSRNQRQWWMYKRNPQEMK